MFIDGRAPGTGISVYVGGWSVIDNDWLTLRYSLNGIEHITAAPSKVVKVRYHRSCAGPNGRVWTVAQTGETFAGPDGNMNRLLIYDGIDWAISPHACVASFGALVARRGADMLVWTQDTKYSGRLLTFYPDGTMDDVFVEAPEPIKTKGSSQGYLQVDENYQPVWTDTRRSVFVNGVTWKYPQIIGDLTSGQYTGDDYIGGSRAGALFTAIQAKAYQPCLAVESSGFTRIGAPLDNGQVAYVECPPFPPFVMPPAPPLQVPDIPPYSHRLYVGAIDGSSTSYGYYSTPGTIELIVRPVDLAKRANPSQPFVLGSDMAQPGMTPKPIALWFEARSDTPPARWEAARLKAAAMDIPIWCYYDGPVWLGPADATHRLLNGYPFPGESVDDCIARVKAEVQRLPPYGLISLLCTQKRGDGSDAHHPQTILDLQPRYVAEIINPFDIQAHGWWTWAPEGRGGPLAFSELSDVASRLGQRAHDVGLPLPDPDPEPPDPEPTPEVPMNIGWSQKPEGPFTEATLVKGEGDNTVMIVKPDGRVVSIQPDGKVDDRDPGTIGAWESARRNGNILAYSDAQYHDDRVYLLYIVERK